jgi:hypothetical protein
VDGALVVAFPGDRQQRVFVEESRDGESLRLWSVAARPSAVRDATSHEWSPHVLAWDRNRDSDLVGFKVDGRGRLIGEAWVPLDGLEAEEWGVWVRTVARSCDRMEYLLTGKDIG